MNIEYHPALEQELKEIIEYYEECSHGLGLDFLDEFEKQVLDIALFPYRWATFEDDLRRVLMDRFPYVIYFRVINEKLLRITVIKHQRRHPDLGLMRD